MTNHETMTAIFQKIKEYDRIMLFRHVRVDGDCTGATKGLQDIIRTTWPEKEVLLIDNEVSDYLAFLGPDDAPVADEVYSEALGIVLDTATAERISNPKYTLCKELIKIDHHIPVDSYGNFQWVEEKATSVCEMIVKFYDTFRDELQLSQKAAFCLYTGMVTDSGRFRYKGLSGDTLRYAAILLDQGIDTDILYANLYLESFENLKFKSYVYDKMQITEHGVAYILVDRKMQERFHLSREDAGSAVDCLDSIHGTLCWMAFIETDDGTDSIRVRLRSRFMSINTLAEQYRGGGHANASGATIYTKDEMDELIAKADAMSKEYKENHKGWL